MPDTHKHLYDIFTFLAAVAVWFKVITDILSFFVVLAGAVWWILRFHEWWKTRKVE
jgi:hypothetical protein